MKFKIGEKKEEIIEIPLVESLQDVFLQSQETDDINYYKQPPRFTLAWEINCKNEKRIKSEWTPNIDLSITRTMEINKDAKELIIYGKNILNQYELELAKIKYSLVRSFGYIAERSASSKGKEYILGIWIELIGNRMIKIYRSGKVKETLK